MNPVTVAPRSLPVAQAVVTLDGVALPPEARRDLVAVTAQDDLDAPSVFTLALRLSGWDAPKRRFTWADDELFAIGRSVEIAFGNFGGAIAPVMSGEITSLDLEVATGATPTLLVRGYDLRHRLLRGTRTRAFLEMTDSAIAAQIAEENDLVPAVTDSLVEHASVLQYAETDLGFLRRRAADIGYEVAVEGRTLLFRPPLDEEPPALALAMDRDVIEFNPRMTSRGQASGVELRGWDPDLQQPIVGTAAPAVPTPADRAFGPATLTRVDQPVRTTAEAEQIARGMMEEMSLSFFRGEGTCLGRTDLKAGTVIDLQGLGLRFGGSYYVISTKHTFSEAKGYRTRFTVRRDAA